MKKLWFKNKTYGWGWTPATREGWIVLAVYLVLVFITLQIISKTVHTSNEMLLASIVPFILLTGALLWVCYLTGEKPEWRWGEKKK